MYELSLTVLIIFAMAYIDWEHLVDGDYIENHRSRWACRFLVIIAVGHLNWLLTLGCGLMFAAVFDQVLNAMRGKGLLYLGSVSPWDLFWKKRIWLYVSMSIISYVISMYLCLISTSFQSYADLLGLIR